MAGIIFDRSFGVIFPASINFSKATMELCFVPLFAHERIEQCTQNIFSICSESQYGQDWA